MKSLAIQTNEIQLPFFDDEVSMIPFDLGTLRGLEEQFKSIASDMIKGINGLSGRAYFTIHGRKLVKGETLRRGGPHTDGNYEPVVMGFGGGGPAGWKVGEDGPTINSKLHKRQYINPCGGIILASNFESCLGWIGEYEGNPGVGGDCSHIELDNPFMLDRNRVYYGNNHFIHESLPMSGAFHRVFARITLPEYHRF